MFRTLLIAALFVTSTSTARAGLFEDHWVPTARTCAADVETVTDQIKTTARSCRSSASTVDALGNTHVNSVTYGTCMADAGWTRARRAEKKAWLASCPVESDTASSQVAAR